MASSWDCAWGPDPLAEDVAQCETCDKWPHGIGSNRCVCCAECGGQGSYSDERHLYRKCESCDGTGRAKAVAS